MSPHQKFIFLIFIFSLLGCGKQGFMVGTATSQQKAPGSFLIPPKVDLLLAEDDTGSIKEIYNVVANELAGFLGNLDNRNWDYRFGTIPLTTARKLDQIVGSRYDANWGSLWLAPYPDAPSSGPGYIATDFFRTPGQYTGFLSPSDATNNLKGYEPGLLNITNSLHGQISKTGFLRDDALFVVLVVGNGQDTSAVNICNDQNISAPCGSYASRPLCTDISQALSPGHTCDSRALSFNYFQNQLQAIKPDPKQFQFHAAVSVNGSACLGKSSSHIGTRYMQMATATGGQSYDICSQSVGSILNALANNLETTRLKMETHYLFINQEPDPTTIRVTKNVGGSANQSVSIPQDATNGWTYAGHLTDVYAIDVPVKLNLSSGYAIELHGTAKLSGDDTASVEFLPLGSQNSAK